MINLVVTQAVHDELLDLARYEVETGGVLLARFIQGTRGTAKLVASKFVPVPDEAYERRDATGLEVLSDGYIDSLKEAASSNQVAIWTHTHPGDGSEPLPSNHDRVVNDALRELFALRTESNYYAWLIVGHNDGELTFTGALESDEHEPDSIERLTVVGDRFQVVPSFESETSTPPGIFDRNIRAFGPDIQNLLGELTVAVVGAGGTGSSVAEQLARLGVRNFILLDFDSLSDSNTTRVYGSTPDDVGRHKVDVLGDHLERIATGVNTVRVVGSIVKRENMELLTTADLVFGCTDDDAGRLRLSRLPYYYLVPVIDCGVRLESDTTDTISGIFGRVTSLHPGSTCLVCRGRVSLARAAAEVRPPDEQARLVKEGYAPALGRVEPAVVAFTTVVAATAVGEMLERLIGYGETPSPTEQLLFLHDRMIRLTEHDPVEGHYCDPARVKVGSDSEDWFMEMNW